MAEISILSAKRFYKTILYCDSLSKEILSELPFDEIVVLESLENYKGIWYTVPKMITMVSQSDPFIHIDLDTIIFNKINIDSELAIGFPEVSDDEFKFISYKNPLKNVFKKDISFYDFSIIPNTSLVLSNNIKLITELYSNILNEYEDIVNSTNENFIENYGNNFGGIPSVLDQFLFYQEILKSECDFKFILNHQNTTLLPEIQYIDSNGVIFNGIKNVFEKSNFVHIPNYEELLSNDDVYNDILNLLKE